MGMWVLLLAPHTVREAHLAEASNDPQWVAKADDMVHQHVLHDQAYLWSTALAVNFPMQTWLVTKWRQG